MRRRLLWVSLSLTGALLLALMAPLLTTYAADRTQDAFVARLGDVTRFAVLAEDTLETGEADALRTDLERYVDVYGGSVLVVNANREVVVRAGSADVEALPGASDTVERSLRGAGSRQPGTVWPWSEDQMLIGSPVGRDAQVLGAVVMAAPTQNVQSGVLQGLAWMTLLGLVTLLVTTYGLVVPFVGWILRPVHDLDHAAKQLAGGDLSSRAHAAGPPELRDLATSFNAMADSVETSQRQQQRAGQ
jgi:methyl-accepting chemotaxis protein